jgi:flagellar protein FliO/FliZ
MSFFGGMPFPVQFFLAFVIVLGLIGATAWAVRRFGTGRLGGAGMRGRQPRLAVIDYASVDGRRRLILVRRDNVEHLVMIGGPTDVVVESNIVRATAAPRDISVARPPATAEALPRAIPLPDNAGNGSWPLQPEPAAAVGAPRAARSEPLAEEAASWPLQAQAEAPARPSRDTLAALADELSPRPAAAPRNRPQPNARPHPEPRQSAAQPAAVEPGAAVDQSLAEMAHQLEAALRKPAAKTDSREARAQSPRAPMPGTHAAAAETAPPAPARSPRAPDVKPPRADAKPPGAGKALYDSLEQEMASLLGRPTSKH